MPAFNEVFGGPPEPEACVTSITPELQQHVAAMKTQGWGAKLADQATPMWGCGAETDAKECLKDLPVVTEPWKPAGVEQTMRVLRDLPRTSYWVRSSADGRFVGYGQFTSAAVIDLNKAAGTPTIQVDARYDPAFFPDNNGVSFAGTDLANNTPGPIKVCKQSALIAAANLMLAHEGVAWIVLAASAFVGWRARQSLRWKAWLPLALWVQKNLIGQQS